MSRIGRMTKTDNEKKKNADMPISPTMICRHRISKKDRGKYRNPTVQKHKKQVY